MSQNKATSANWAMGIVKALGNGRPGLPCLVPATGPGLRRPQRPRCAFSARLSLTRLWQRAVGLSGNPAIGLNMGKVVRPASFRRGRLSLMSSNTLAEGFMRLVRYQRIIAKCRPEFSACCRRLLRDPHGSWRSPATDPAKRRSVAGLCIGIVRLADRSHPATAQGAVARRAAANLAPYRQAFHAP